MKTNIILIILMVMIVCSGIAGAEVASEKDIFFKLFSYNENKIEELFHKSFLKQVPIKSIIKIINDYKKPLGSLKKVEKSTDGYTLIFENGSIPAKIKINQQQEITGLWFGKITVTPDKDSSQEILTEFKKLSGKVSVCVVKNGKETVLAYNENRPMAVGSSFKLYVLKAVYENINSGNKSWEDIIELNNKNRSLPSGILQKWPESTPLTVKTLTNLMISISDNTATDHLIDFVGREKMESYLSKENRPFFKTEEFFKLKYAVDSKLQSKYIQGNLDIKRSILRDLKNIDIQKVDSKDTPTLINEVEWFFSTKELCQVIYSLKDGEEIKINSGLVSKENWNLVGYKGGSEPGVLQYTHVLQKEKGDSIYTISVTVNNPEEDVNKTKITELTTRLISLIEKENI